MKPTLENLLFKSLIEVLGDKRAHEVFDHLSTKLGGMEIKLAMHPIKPAAVLLAKEMRAAKMHKHEIKELFGMLRARKIYVPTTQYDGY